MPHANVPDSAVAPTAARHDGYAILGQPRREPKHFEVLGQRDGTTSELRIELGGEIRKSKQVPKDDQKWVAELRGAR